MRGERIIAPPPRCFAPYLTWLASLNASGSTNVFGHLNTSVLVQEFLSGKEYVVDSVSVEGIHKTVSIWEYDKRPANGAKFVYYGMRLYESEDGEREKALVEYMHGVLDSLQVKNGPSHGEVRLDEERRKAGAKRQQHTAHHITNNLPLLASPIIPPPSAIRFAHRRSCGLQWDLA